MMVMMRTNHLELEGNNISNIPVLSTWCHRKCTNPERTRHGFHPSKGFHLRCQFQPSPNSYPSSLLEARQRLLGLVSDQQRGVRTLKDPLRRSEIIQAFEELASKGGGDAVTTRDSLSATWRMLWTTEKEQLFIIDKAHLFGTKAGDILQVIDVASGKLNNVITFPPSGAFVVNSTIDIVSAQRVNFRFTAATLTWAGWNIPFPPYGQGWFESVYMDDEIRLAKDIRGDYLIVDRAPYTWEGVK